MALFSPFSSDFFQPFQPLFQLLDDDTFSPVYPVRRANNNNKSAAQAITSFTPRFDVRESKDAYHLDGELPGLTQKDVELTFTDLHTLLIKGSITREYTESSEDKDKNPTAAHAATVEDASEEEKAKEKQQQPQDQVAKSGNTDSTVAKNDVNKPQFKYWVSERSSGSFHRTFNFPARVDQDNVKASLKDGVLSVVVPKAPAPAMKKIEIN